MKTTRDKGRKPSPDDGVPIGDGSGEWTSGLRHEARAALLGSIVAAIPHLDELVADLVSDRLGADARAALAAIEGGDDVGLALLRGLPDTDSALGTALDDYAVARRLCRSYARGLWYTHRSGRTYLAAADAEGAAFRVAREVKPADLRGALQRLDRLAGRLAVTRDAPVARGRKGRPTTSRPEREPKAARPPDAGRKSAPSPPPAAPDPPGSTAAARTKRAAPTRTAGARRRRAPVPPRREGAAPPEAAARDPKPAE